MALTASTREELLKNNPKLSIEDAAQQIDQYIKTYYSEIFNQYSQKTGLLSQLGKNIAGGITKEIQEGLDALEEKMKR